MSTGYIQVDILGRKRGIKFGMLAVQQISLESQKLGKVLGNSVDLALVPVIVYWGLFNNCYNKQEDPDFTFEDVVNYVDDNVAEPTVFTDIIKCLYDSKIVKGDAVDAVDGQKKSTTSTRRKAGTD